MKIVQLTAENIQRLKAVHITPDGHVVEIGGRNAQGKTSVIDSIAMALGGKDLMSEKPVRTGAAKAFAEVDLGEYVVRRSFTAAGGTSLTVKAKDGSLLKSPQALLDQLIGRLSFDPLAFVKLPARQQQETLRQIVGLDTSVLDQERAAVFAQRTEVNRAVASLQARLATMPAQVDAPTTEVSVAVLVQALRDADASYLHADQTRKAFDVVAREWKDTADALATQEARIVALEAEIVACRTRCADIATTRAGLRGRITAAKDVHNAAVAALPDREALRQQVADADATNAAVRANETRAQAEGEYEHARLEAASLSDQLDAIDQQKAAAVAAATYPVPGLAFDAEGGIRFNGEPFGMASTAEKLRVSVAIGLSLNTHLRVLLIRDGWNDLDAAGRALVAQLAQEHDAQLWVERVAESTDGVTVLIEDGEVVAQAAPTPPDAPPTPTRRLRPAGAAPLPLTPGVTLRNTSAVHSGFVDVSGVRQMLKPGETATVPAGVPFATSPYVVEEARS